MNHIKHHKCRGSVANHLSFIQFLVQIPQLLIFLSQKTKPSINSKEFNK